MHRITDCFNESHLIFNFQLVTVWFMCSYMAGLLLFTEKPSWLMITEVEYDRIIIIINNLESLSAGIILFHFKPRIPKIIFHLNFDRKIFSYIRIFSIRLNRKSFDLSTIELLCVHFSDFTCAYWVAESRVAMYYIFLIYQFSVLATLSVNASSMRIPK